MMSLTLLLVFLALIVTIVSATTPPRAPLWIAVLLLCIAMLVGLLPH